MILKNSSGIGFLLIIRDADKEGMENACTIINEQVNKILKGKELTDMKLVDQILMKLYDEKQNSKDKEVQSTIYNADG